MNESVDLDKILAGDIMLRMTPPDLLQTPSDRKQTRPSDLGLEPMTIDHNNIEDLDADKEDDQLVF